MDLGFREATTDNLVDVLNGGVVEEAKALHLGGQALKCCGLYLVSHFANVCAIYDKNKFANTVSCMTRQIKKTNKKNK